MSNKFSKHKWWIVTVLLTLPLIAIAAVPNTFTANTTIASAQVNANFAALDARITALEAATAKTSAKVVLDNSTGMLPTTGRTATFAASGTNPLLIIVSGSAFSNPMTGAPTVPATPTLEVAVQLDGVVIGHLTTYTNEVSSHKAFPTKAFPVAAPAAGNHTLGLAPVTGVEDVNDYFSVTVVELH